MKLWHGMAGTLFLLWVIPGACILAVGWLLDIAALEVYGFGVFLVGGVYTLVLLTFPHALSKEVPLHVRQ